MAVVGRQEILPVAVPVSVDIRYTSLGSRQDVSCRIVGKAVIPLSSCLCAQLALTIEVFSFSFFSAPQPSVASSLHSKGLWSTTRASGATSLLSAFIFHRITCGSPNAKDKSALWQVLNDNIISRQKSSGTRKIINIPIDHHLIASFP